MVSSVAFTRPNPSEEPLYPFSGHPVLTYMNNSYVENRKFLNSSVNKINKFVEQSPPYEANIFSALQKIPGI
jgi:hypothetical protein